MRKTLVALAVGLLMVPLVAASDGPKFDACAGDSFGPLGEPSLLNATFRVAVSNTALSTLETWVCVFNGDQKFVQQRFDIAMGDTSIITVPIFAGAQDAIVRARDDQGAMSQLKFHLTPHECADQTSAVNAVAWQISGALFLSPTQNFCAAVYSMHSQTGPGGEGAGIEPLAASTKVDGDFIAPAAAVAATTLVGMALWFFGKPLLGLFTRLRTPKVLEHPVRAEIVDLIAQDPGVHVSALSTRLELSRRDADYHLNVLQRHGLIAQVLVEGKRCNFPAGYAPTQRQLASLAALRNDSLRGVVDFVRTRPGVGVTEISQHLGLALPVASKRVARLRRMGLVHAERVGRTVQVRVAS